MRKIQDRIAALRKLMSENEIAACIIPGTDPHASEYIASCWKDREWISGFTGSAGTVVIGLTSAALWTDSRYFLQAGDQLANSGIDLMKQGLPETPDILSWLSAHLCQGDKVAVNTRLFSVNGYDALQSDIKSAGMSIVGMDVVSYVWKDRPSLPLSPFYELNTAYAGETSVNKLSLLRGRMKSEGADVLVLSALDDIAWLYNIRGCDVEYNPVTIAFSVIDMQKATLYVASEKLTPQTIAYLSSQGVHIAEYEAVYDNLTQISAESLVWIDGVKLNRSLFEAIPGTCRIKNSMSPVFRMKSLKNETEVTGIRRAMIRDGVALTRFFKWLEENLPTGQLTELSVDDQLRKLRAEQENFQGESFGTIAGFGPHGAIVHYTATEESAAALYADGLFLLDSGGQYLDGTTDITRTITLGNPTALQKQDFSLVLKGHIALAQAVFPVNTRGTQLDVLARNAMWKQGINYGHGTGHGVGHFLNVHEGPQSIRMEENPVTLQEGMLISNEPGLYRTGEHGIRTENLVLVVPAMETEFGKFLKFETMTLCYIDAHLIDDSILDTNDIAWLNNYHRLVYDRLSPFLNGEEQEWLADKCKAL